MPLIYITGVSGSGKTTIGVELKARGYKCFDVDDDGFKAWYNQESDSRASDQRAWQDADVEWRQKYWLKIEKSKVEALSQTAKDELIFLTGTAAGEDEVWDLFGKVIHVSVGEATLKRRLEQRPNDYGKHPRDLQDILEWRKTANERMKSKGAVVIDGEKPIQQLVDSVLDESKRF